MKNVVKTLTVLGILGLVAFGGYTAGIKMYQYRIVTRQSFCTHNVVDVLKEKKQLTRGNYYANMYLCMTSK